MRQIHLAGEEPQHRSALVRDVVADRPAQHRIAGFQLTDAYTCPPVVPKYTAQLSSASTAIASRNTFT
jgi:hypothetical protein